MKHALARKKNTPIKVFPQGAFRPSLYGLTLHGLGVISLVVGHWATMGCGSHQAEVKATQPAQATPSLEDAPAIAHVEAHSPPVRPSAQHAAESLLTFADQALVARVPSSWGLVAEPSLGAWGRASTSQSEDQFWVSHQPARRTITLSECENEARASLQVLRHGLAATNERPWDPLAGYAGTLRVILLDDGATLIEGYAVGLSRCLSAVYRVSGGQDYAQRVRLVVTSVLSQLSLRQRTVGVAPTSF